MAGASPQATAQCFREEDRTPGLPPQGRALLVPDASSHPTAAAASAMRTLSANLSRRAMLAAAICRSPGGLDLREATCGGPQAAGPPGRHAADLGGGRLRPKPKRRGGGGERPHRLAPAGRRARKIRPQPGQAGLHHRLARRGPAAERLGQPPRCLRIPAQPLPRGCHARLRLGPRGSPGGEVGADGPALDPAAVEQRVERDLHAVAVGVLGGQTAVTRQAVRIASRRLARNLAARAATVQSAAAAPRATPRCLPGGFPAPPRRLYRRGAV